jgi:succinylglutamate desuccinylase
MSEPPRWLEIQAEVDYLYFSLRQMQKAHLNRSGIELMIDKATSYEANQVKEAKKIMKRIKKLIAEYERVTQPSKPEK